MRKKKTMTQKQLSIFTEEHHVRVETFSIRNQRNQRCLFSSPRRLYFNRFVFCGQNGGEISEGLSLKVGLWFPFINVKPADFMLVSPLFKK